MTKRQHRYVLPQRDADQDRPAIRISPSILSSDFARLAEECNAIVREGADWLHVDVMDGHFVPNLTLGALVLKALSKHVDGFMDCHLMVSNPEQWIKDFADAGADMFTFHLEAVAPELNTDRHEAVVDLTRKVRSAGMYVGIALRPDTAVECVIPYVEAGDVDLVLPLSVEPGFGGQSFQPEMMSKVRTLRDRFKDLQIEVDGGISPSTIEHAAKAGANVIVAGSAVFGSSDRAGVMRSLRESCEAAAVCSSQM